MYALYEILNATLSMWSNVVLFYSPYIISGRMCSLFTKITLNTADHLVGWCTMLHLPVSSGGGGGRVGGGGGGVRD